ncbi:MAG: DUF1320 family protein [Bacteroidales bacterium]|nr:DUF1320 family protein [Bacteroidales bacterium]
MNSFLSKEELKTVAAMPTIEKITNGNDFVVEQIIDESIAVMRSYLSRRYNTDAIFSATGNARHLTVLKYLKDIVIFEIYDRLTREENEVAGRRYEAAIKWLESLNDGSLADDTLPPAITPEGQEASSGDVRFGSNTQYQSRY